MKEKYIKTIIKNLTCSKKKKEEIKNRKKEKEFHGTGFYAVEQAAQLRWLYWQPVFGESFQSFQ